MNGCGCSVEQDKAASYLRFWGWTYSTILVVGVAGRGEDSEEMVGG